MTEIQMLHAGEIPPAELSGFLEQFFPEEKVRFLTQSGTWWHQGDHNRWVLKLQNQIAAYCAIMPTRILVRGRVEPAFWWVDLVVQERFRGQGLQSILDEKVREIPDTRLGFPNELAARIHLRHGWQVRSDLRVLLLPLRPFRLVQVKRARGARRLFFHAFALALSPWAGWRKRRALHSQPSFTPGSQQASPELLAKVFDRYRQPQVVTTCRDKDFFQWRYFGSPMRSQYRFYLQGDPSSPSHYAVTRTLHTHGEQVVRVLDLFGDFQDRKGMGKIVERVVSDAARQHASQVTVLVSLPEIEHALRRAGFFLSANLRFCWSSEQLVALQGLAGRCYWTFADSDNDEGGDA